MDKTDKSTSHVDLNGYDRETQQLEKNEQRMERVSSLLAIFLRVLSFLLQSANPILCLLTRIRVAITASAARCLEQYYNAASGVWLDNTMTYPTILNLIAALVIVIFNSIALCAYIGGKATLEKWMKHEGLANIIQTTLCTIAAGIMLGTSSTSNSIEGQACQGAQQNASGMSTICNLQQFIQYAMLAQSWMGTVIYAWSVVLERHRKKLTQHTLQKSTTSPTAAKVTNGKE